MPLSTRQDRQGAAVAQKVVITNGTAPGAHRAHPGAKLLALRAAAFSAAGGGSGAVDPVFAEPRTGTGFINTLTPKSGVTSGAIKPSLYGLSAARLNRLRKNSKEQIPRGAEARSE